MAIKFDKILGKLREDDTTGGTASISQVDSDPASPSAEDAWVLHTTTGQDGTAGEPRGLLLALTYTGTVGGHTYQFSYYTKEGTIVRVTLS